MLRSYDKKGWEILSTPPAVRWLIRATGSLSDLPRIADDLAGGDLQVNVDGGSLYVMSPAVNRMDSQETAEWAAYEFVRLISAAARLRFGTLPLEFQSAEAQADPIAPTPHVPGKNGRGLEGFSLLQAVTAAERREYLRTALLACAAGGAEGGC